MDYKCRKCNQTGWIPPVKVFREHGLWRYYGFNGEDLFCPNRCCKCMRTTDSQSDRFCDDCYRLAPWYERTPDWWLTAIAAVLTLINVVLWFQS